MDDDASNDTAALNVELEGCRQEIDRLDANLLSILAERFSATRRIGEIKRALGLPPIDRDREAQQRERIRILARHSAIDEQLALDLLHLVIDRVVIEHSSN